jgi:hypothetical protein
MKILIFLHFIAGIIVMIDGFLKKDKWYGPGYQHHPAAANFLFAFIPIVNIPFAILIVYRWIKWIQ